MPWSPLQCSIRVSTHELQNYLHAGHNSMRCLGHWAAAAWQASPPPARLLTSNVHAPTDAAMQLRHCAGARASFSPALLLGPLGSCCLAGLSTASSSAGTTSARATLAVTLPTLTVIWLPLAFSTCSAARSIPHWLMGRIEKHSLGDTANMPLRLHMLRLQLRQAEVSGFLIRARAELH